MMDWTHEISGAKTSAPHKIVRLVYYKGYAKHDRGSADFQWRARVKLGI